MYEWYEEHHIYEEQYRKMIFLRIWELFIQSIYI